MIRQFDVVVNPIRAWRADKPFLLNIQHDLLFASKTRILAPLVILGSVKGHNRLYPELRVHDQRVILTPDELITLEIRRFSRPVANLEADREKIIAALDFVLTGI